MTVWVATCVDHHVQGIIGVFRELEDAKRAVDVWRLESRDVLLGEWEADGEGHFQRGSFYDYVIRPYEVR